MLNLLMIFLMYILLCVAVGLMLYWALSFFDRHRGWGLIVLAGTIAFGLGIMVEGRVAIGHTIHIKPVMHKIP